MRLRAWKLGAALRLHEIARGRRLDLLVTHAPPRGIHDSPDPVHRGFAAFLPSSGGTSPGTTSTATPSPGPESPPGPGTARPR